MYCSVCPPFIPACPVRCTGFKKAPHVAHPCCRADGCPTAAHCRSSLRYERALVVELCCAPRAVERWGGHASSVPSCCYVLVQLVVVVAARTHITRSQLGVRARCCSLATTQPWCACGEGGGRCRARQTLPRALPPLNRHTLNRPTPPPPHTHTHTLTRPGRSTRCSHAHVRTTVCADAAR